MTNPNHVVFVWHLLRATGYGLVCFGAWGAENNSWSWGGHGCLGLGGRVLLGFVLGRFGRGNGLFL
eukprot:9348449-Lingulodinium_polyedra.AAC.1